MAIDDLLAAITQEIDMKIAEAKEAHRKQVSAMREESDLRLMKKREELTEQCGEKERQMRAKGDVHMSLSRRNALLQKKQSLLETLYDDVVDALTKEKPAVIEAFIKKCLDTIKHDGEIRPAKSHETMIKKIADKKHFTIGAPIDAKGGFMYVSDKEERDYTFEHIVHSQLRPHTEVDVASALFAA